MTSRSDSNYLWSRIARSSYHKAMHRLLRLRHFFKLLVGLFGAGLFLVQVAGCTWRVNERPSILVIAVEGLSSEAFDCSSSEDEFDKGLGVLCREGVRFTHAYTPSTQSQATLASVLTGLYPKDHGVWHNGAVYLSEKFQTVSKEAVERGYHTSFFSGGAPVWRKSGLEQGFELFDDNIALSLHDLYRPAKKNFDLLQNWLSEIGDRAPFFSFVFLPDLQFLHAATVDEHGRQRPAGFEGQLHEINSSLATLFANLKKAKQWDNTYIFLVGLNGQTKSQRPGEFSSINLFSENTQVQLIIKGAHKPSETNIDWSIDTNVSLVDLGATIFDILEAPVNLRMRDPLFEVTSLRSALLKPQVTWARDRLILSESAWPLWRGVSNTRLAVRQNHMLLIYDSKPSIYNSLTDRFERQAIALNDPSAKNTVSEIISKLQASKMNSWEGLPPKLADKIILAQQIFSLPSMADVEALQQPLTILMQQRPWDRQLAGWLARIAIAKHNWDLLEQLGTDYLFPDWVYVAKKSKGETGLKTKDICLAFLERNYDPEGETSVCNDKEMRALYEYLQTSEKERRLAAEEKFAHIWGNSELDEEISRLNFVNSLNWDAQVDLPAEPRLFQLAQGPLHLVKLPSFIGASPRNSK
jgi:Sulfatase